MGSGCASILVPPGDPVFSFIIQHENYICRDEMIGIIGATVSWFYIFKTLILKYFRQCYVHIIMCKSAKDSKNRKLLPRTSGDTFI